MEQEAMVVEGMRNRILVTERRLGGVECVVFWGMNDMFHVVVLISIIAF